MYSAADGDERQRSSNLVAVRVADVDRRRIAPLRLRDEVERQRDPSVGIDLVHRLAVADNAVLEHDLVRDADLRAGAVTACELERRDADGRLLLRADHDDRVAGVELGSGRRKRRNGECILRKQF